MQKREILNETPPNLVALASHGSHKIPSEFQELLNPGFTPIIQKNFADWATRYLTWPIPRAQKVIPNFSRAIGDPNREYNPKNPESDKLFRKTTFGGVPIWQRELNQQEKEKGLDLSYRPYHREIREILARVFGNSNDKLLVVDFHTTAHYRFTPNGFEMRQDGVPPIIISNCDGETSKHQTLIDLQNALQVHLGLSASEIELNRKKFKGGYVTRFYGDVSLSGFGAGKQPREVLQFEVRRDLLMNEKKQTLLLNFRETRRKILQAIFEVADGLKG